MLLPICIWFYALHHFQGLKPIWVHDPLLLICYNTGDFLSKHYSFNCLCYIGDKLVGEVSRLVVAEACIQALDIDFTEGQIYEINSVPVSNMNFYICEEFVPLILYHTCIYIIAILVVAAILFEVGLLRVASIAKGVLQLFRGKWVIVKCCYGVGWWTRKWCRKMERIV